MIAIASSFSPSFCFLRTQQKLLNLQHIFNARMATFTVRGGLNPQRKLPDTQMLIIGRQSLLKTVEFNKELAEKLAPVSADHFDNAKALLNAGNGSVPLHMDFAKVLLFSRNLDKLILLRSLQSLRICRATTHHRTRTRSPRRLKRPSWSRELRFFHFNQ